MHGTLTEAHHGDSALTLFHKPFLEYVASDVATYSLSIQANPPSHPIAQLNPRGISIEKLVDIGEVYALELVGDVMRGPLPLLSYQRLLLRAQLLGQHASAGRPHKEQRSTEM